MATIDEQCIAAFRKVNFAEAVRLLPLVRKSSELFISDYVYAYSNGYTNDCKLGLLHLAVRNRWLDVVKDLITKYNIEPTKGGSDMYTLHVAVENNHIDIIKYLINQWCCDPNVADSRSRTCLHLAVEKNHIDVVKYLINQCGCIPNAPYLMGITCLHIAVEKNHIELVKYLINQCGCDPNVADELGRTCLHVAVQKNHIVIAEYLIMQCRCNPAADRKLSRKCLDIAMNSINLDFLKYLINHCGCDPNVADKLGRTCLHVAVQKNHIGIVACLIMQCRCNPAADRKLSRKCLDIAMNSINLDFLKYLINQCGCDPNAADSVGKTCLHVAVEKNYIIIAKYLIIQCQCNPKADKELSRRCLDLPMNSFDLDFLKYLINQCGCDPNVADGLGRTCLHAAVEKNDFDVVKYLINLCVCCDPNVADTFSRTCLHMDVKEKRFDVVKYLINECSCDPKVADGLGRTCLHVAVEKNCANIVTYLIMHYNCNPKPDEKLNRKCFDIAVNSNDLSFLKYLINQCDCDPNVADEIGKTCLHVAVENCNLPVVEYLLSTGKVNPSAKDNNNMTPLMLANGNEAIPSLFTKFGKIKTSHPVDSYVNVLLLGNPGAGKSTLAQVIIERANGAFTFGQFRNVKDVELCTAGIIPTKLEHKELGNVILHDFAGHSEYYSSHTAVIENLLQGSGAVFVIVVDITNEELSKHLHQWLTVVNNEVHKCSSQCHIHVAASHIDKMIDDITTKNKLLQESSEVIIFRCGPGFPIKTLDCRKLGGSNITSLLNELSSSCQSIRNTSGRDLSLYCHMMYAFLKDSQQNILSLSDIVNSPLKHQYALPEKVEEIHETFYSLNSTGLIHLVKSHEDTSKVWVVVNKQILLAEVDGILFAPKSFKEYRNVASNTGIIASSSLIHLFPHYDPDMLIYFLTNMALCQEINPQFFTMINLKPNFDINDDKLLFFPSLLNIDRPHDITGQVFKFGWCLQCTEDYHFFPPRFFHIIMLHLAYKFGLPKHSGHLPIIDRKCTFWKNGIHWFINTGVQTLVEMVDESQCALVLMSCEERCINDMISLRKDVIAELIEVKIQSFPSLKTSEFLIDPLQLIYPIYKPRHRTVYNVADIIASIRDKKDFVISDDPQSGDSNILKLKLIRELLTNEEITDITQLSIVGERHLTSEELTRTKEYDVSDNTSIVHNGTHLDYKPKLHDLMNILAKIAPQYNLIGIALKIPMNSLGLIPLPDYHKENLSRTLEWWLNNGDSVGSPVTWDNIINAIGGPIVENFHIAEEMRQFYDQLKDGDSNCYSTSHGLEGNKNYQQTIITIL